MILREIVEFPGEVDVTLLVIPDSRALIVYLKETRLLVIFHSGDFSGADFRLWNSPPDPEGVVSLVNESKR